MALLARVFVFLLPMCAISTDELCDKGLCDVAGCTCWSSCAKLSPFRNCVGSVLPPSGFKYTKTDVTGNDEGCDKDKGEVRDQCELIGDPPTADCHTHAECLGLDGLCCPDEKGVNAPCCDGGDKLCENSVCSDAGCTCFGTCSVVEKLRTCGDDKAPEGFEWKLTGSGKTSNKGCSKSPIGPPNVRDECELIAKEPNTKCNTHPKCLGIKGDCCPNDKGETLGCCADAQETVVATSEFDDDGLCEQGLCKVAGCTCWSDCSIAAATRTCDNPPAGWKYSKTDTPGGNKNGCNFGQQRDKCYLYFDGKPGKDCHEHEGCYPFDGDCCPADDGKNNPCCSKEDELCEYGVCDEAGCKCFSTCNAVASKRECGDAPAGFSWKKSEGSPTSMKGCTVAPGGLNVRDQCELVASVEETDLVM